MNARDSCLKKRGGKEKKKTKEKKRKEKGKGGKKE